MHIEKDENEALDDLRKDMEENSFLKPTNMETETFEKARKFYEAHKHLKGKDFRLELLKLSKEEIFDYSQVINDDRIFGWRNLLNEAEIKIKNLESELSSIGGEESRWVEIPFGEWFNSEPKDGIYFYIDENGHNDIFKFENKYFLDMDGRRSQKKIGMKFVLQKSVTPVKSGEEKTLDPEEQLNARNSITEDFITENNYDSVEDACWALFDKGAEWMRAKLAVTPVKSGKPNREAPTNQEIIAEANTYKHLHPKDFKSVFHGFIEGAKWMRSKLK